MNLMDRQSNFSIIFQDFDRKIHFVVLRGIFEQVFGQAGCAASLTMDLEGKHRPCELAANLSVADAQAKAEFLRQAGLQIALVPTASVTNVRHRAAECWPTHVASNGETFTLLGNVVLKGCSLNAPASLRESQQESSWGFELSYNHEHPSTTLDRAGLRAARRRGADITAALQECFPDRDFLISYRCEQVSFCQFTEELPVGITPGERRVDDFRLLPNQLECCFCEHCQSTVGYQLKPTTDPEFPHAQFASCDICSGEVILWVDDETVAVSQSNIKQD